MRQIDVRGARNRQENSGDTLLLYPAVADQPEVPQRVRARPLFSVAGDRGVMAPAPGGTVTLALSDCGRTATVSSGVFAAYHAIPGDNKHYARFAVVEAVCDAIEEELTRRGQRF